MARTRAWGCPRSRHFPTRSVGTRAKAACSAAVSSRPSSRARRCGTRSSRGRMAEYSHADSIYRKADAAHAQLRGERTAKGTGLEVESGSSLGRPDAGECARARVK